MDLFPGPKDKGADWLVAADYEKGTPILHLLRPRSEVEGGGSELLWYCELERCQGSVSLCGWAGQAAVFADQYGCFYLVDFASRQLRLLKQFQLGFMDAKGVVSSDGKALLVLFEKGRCHYLQRIGLDGELTPAVELDLYDDDAFGGGFDYRDEDEPYFSISLQHRLYPGPGNSLILHGLDDDYDHETEQDFWFQYLLRLDLVEGQPRFRVFPLATPPADWDPEPGVIAVSPARSLAAVPVLGEAALGIEWVSLDDGRRSAPVWVRPLDENGLESLGTSLFSTEEEALWLGWGYDGVRRLALDGRLASPLLQASGKLIGVGAQLTFDCSYAFARTRLPACTASALDEVQPLALDPQDWRHNWQLTQAQRMALSGLGQNLIRVESLAEPAQQRAALQQLVALTADCRAVSRGKTLLFLFADQDQQWGEEAFFKAAAKQPDALALMAQVLEHFIATPGSDGLEGLYGQPPLADCALQLGLQDAAYLPLVCRYLEALDNDHDGFFVGQGDGLYQLQVRHQGHPAWAVFDASHPYNEADDE